MSLLGKLLVLSSLVLITSIFVFKSIDVDQINEKLPSVWMLFVNALSKIDLVLNKFGITGFYCALENGYSYLQYYMVNSSGLNIERKDFDGVEVFIFEPMKHEPNRSAIVHFHGSGWIFFNPKYFSHYLSKLARRLNIMIVSVNYRKAPKYPFPTGFSDALIATKYFLNNAEMFDVDPNRIALMGDSAGGNFVIALGYHLSRLKKQNSNTRTPKILVPMIPTLQMVDMNTPSLRNDSREEFLKKPIFMNMVCIYAFGDLSSEDLDDCINIISTNNHLREEVVDKLRKNVDWEQYLIGSDYENIPKSQFAFTPNKFENRFSELVLDPRFSPLSALSNKDLRLLPPVYLLAASKDILRDDAKILAARLLKIGRLGDYKEFNQSHAELYFVGLDKFDEVCDYLRHILNENL